MNDLRVTSWADLIDRLYEHSWNADLGRFRSNYAFRGVADAAYPLDTSLMRLGGPYPQVENHLLRNFRKYAAAAGAGGACAGPGLDDSIWAWLALGAHHGLPTRVLDWTYSPFVALHFATADLDRFNCDAAIWCVDFVVAHTRLPPRLRELLAREGSNVFAVEMLAQSALTLPEFDQLAPDDFIMFFEPPSLDARIVNQYALFSVISNPAQSVGAWLAQHPEMGRRIILPAALKAEVRDKLDQANITERVLFPGLDGLSAWLRRQYAPKRA